MQAARPIKSVRVWSRHFDHAQKFAAQMSAGRSIRIRAVDSVKEAVDGADIICTVTSATEPILAGIIGGNHPFQIPGFSGRGCRLRSFLSYNTGETQ